MERTTTQTSSAQCPRGTLLKKLLRSGVLDFGVEIVVPFIFSRVATSYSDFLGSLVKALTLILLVTLNLELCKSALQIMTGRFNLICKSR